MIGRWLRRRVEIAGVKGAREDITRFADSLRGMPPIEIAQLRLLATAMRVAAEREGKWREGICDVHPQVHPMAYPAAQLQFLVGRQIISFSERRKYRRRGRHDGVAQFTACWINTGNSGKRTRNVGATRKGVKSCMLKRSTTYINKAWTFRRASFLT